MSHRAVNWALEQRNLKPGPWVVLIKLADRHNKDTLRVDPEQSLLAEDCNMSRATVNRHLDDLEAMGLLLRMPRMHPRTRKQLSTFYVLQINFDAPPDIEFAVSDFETRLLEVQTANKGEGRVSDCDTETVSQKSAKPCLKNGQPRVSNCDTNPGIEPGKEPCAAEAAPQPIDFLSFHDAFIAAYPRLGNAEETEKQLRVAIDGGADPTDILHGVRCYALEQKDNHPRYVAYSENWLREKRWATFPKAEEVSAADAKQRVDQTRAQAIRERHSWVQAHVSAASARELVQAGLVTREECSAAGIQT